MLSLLDLDLEEKKVLLRADFNVPMDKSGNITDDTRIKETLPTIKYILEKGGSVIIMSHLGRPKGKPDPALSLQPVAKRLSELLHKPVLFAKDCIGKETEEMAATLEPGQILLLENLRFYPAEEDPKLDPSFAQKLAKLGDVYVNDAFGAAHRAHSSTYIVPQSFPGKAAPGFLMQKEVSFLTALASNPKRPFYAIIGGAKISTKFEMLKSLLSKVDGLFIGGGMAFTLLKAQGVEIGNSLCEENLIPEAKLFLNYCETDKIPLFLPVDIVAADEFTEDAKSKIVSIKEGVPPSWVGMDIGPQTLRTWKAELENAGTVLWNGPVGVFEFPAFAKGTSELAKTVADLKAVTVVGGGDSIAAINKLKLADKFTHVSTGGGASLEFLELGHLPGVDILL